ncbi:MAG: proline--tRNA ligase [Buchnera aphidicola (Nurudea ibofushi)]
MRAKKYLFSTLRENPHYADSISHKLMIRAGIIRQSSSGIYTWLPTGLRILKNIKKIIKSEMQKINALEVQMPMLQSENLWKLSDRKKTYGAELFKISDRKNNNFVLGPTHEEIITNLVRNELKSYKQLPLLLYQIQTKFRDEIRPRFGVIRSREFIMKDAYSFHISSLSLNKTYNLIKNVYKKIFLKMKLNFHIVEADSKTMGGVKSHEFQALSSNGEDSIALSTKSNYAANIQVATSKRKVEKHTLNHIAKKNFLKTLPEMSNKCFASNMNTIKTILVKPKKNTNYDFIAILLRGDHTINESKLSKIKIISYPVIFASKIEILKLTGTTENFIGPIGLNIPILADFSVISLKNFTIGSNVTGKYFNNMNWNVNLSFPKIFDIRNVLEGDISPDGIGKLKILKSIEIGHIFQLGEKYSKTMKAQVQDHTGYKKFLKMGCYGIGVTRTVAAIIEQNNDDKGIIWPISVAPFKIAIVPINLYASKIVQNESKSLYYLFKNNNISVLLDDRNERSGKMLSDIELIGIPYIVIISENLLKENKVECRNRSKNTKIIISKDDIIALIQEEIKIS